MVVAAAGIAVRQSAATVSSHPLLLCTNKKEIRYLIVNNSS